MGESTGELTFERVWTMFQETDRRFQEMALKTDREIEKVNDSPRPEGRGIVVLQGMDFMRV
jgi:hypothetical protein